MNDLGKTYPYIDAAMSSNFAIFANLVITIGLLIYFFSVYLRWNAIRRDVGLDDFVSKLGGSVYHPDIALDQIQTSFDFMGHGASKWTIKNKEKLSQAIERVRASGGRLRFLIFNPLILEGAGDPKILLPAERIKILKSLIVLFEMMDTYNDNSNGDEKTVSVHLYNNKPSFRLAFINRARVLVSHYRDYTRNSIDSPVLVFSLGSDNWGYYSVYAQHFKEAIDKSVDASAVREEIFQLAKEREAI